MLDTTLSKPSSHPASLYQEALSGPGGAWSCDLATEVLSWTDGVYDLFGIQRGRTLHRSMALDVYQSQSRSEMERHRAAAIRSGKGFVLDCQLRSGGRSRWMRLRLGVSYDQGRPIRIFGSKQDVTAEKKMWDGLVTAAGQDPLTGLTNRRAFEEATRELSRQAALAVLSIDDVETLRERHDHAGALACLRCLGERLARQFPDAILVSRIGGGEFALLLRIGGAGALGATLVSAHRLLTRQRGDRARPVGRRGPAQALASRRPEAAFRRGRFRALCGAGGREQLCAGFRRHDRAASSGRADRHGQSQPFTLLTTSATLAPNASAVFRSPGIISSTPASEGEVTSRP